VRPQATNAPPPDLDPFQRLNLRRQLCPQDRRFSDFDVLEQLGLVAGFVHRMDGIGRNDGRGAIHADANAVDHRYQARAFSSDKWLCTRQALLNAAQEIVRLRAAVNSILARAGHPKQFAALKIVQGRRDPSDARSANFSEGVFEVVREVREEERPAGPVKNQPA
jgi:hypothetical protein